MAFCSNCGTEVQGRFCGKCGSPMGASAAPGANPAAPGAPPPPPPQYSNPPYAGAPAGGAQSAGLEENMACALCYALMILTGILFLVLAPYNQNRLIRFHAWQAIFTWVGLAAIGIGLSIIGALPFVGLISVFVLWPVFAIGAFILWLMLMYKAYNRERWVLPVIGPVAEKQA